MMNIDNAGNRAPFVGRKLSIDELRASIGALTSDFEVSDADQQAFEEQRLVNVALARQALDAYYLRPNEPTIRQEEAERYAHSVQTYTEAMLAMLDSQAAPASQESEGADIIVHPAFTAQLELDETA